MSLSDDVVLELIQQNRSLIDAVNKALDLVSQNQIPSYYQETSPVDSEPLTSMGENEDSYVDVPPEGGVVVIDQEFIDNIEREIDDDPDIT